MITASVSRTSGRLVALVLSLAVVAGIASPAKAAAATQLSTNASALVGWNAPTRDLNLLTAGASQTLKVSSASVGSPLVSTDIVSVESDDTTVVDIASSNAAAPTDATPDGTGDAAFTITPLNPGIAHLYFTSGSLGDVTVTVNVADPSLSANKSSLGVVIGQNFPLSVSSLNLPIPAGTAVDVVSSDSDTVTTIESSVNTGANGTAVFNVAGLQAGSETLTFRALNYADINVAVNVVVQANLVAENAVTNLLSGALASNVSFTSADGDLVPGTVFTVESTDTTAIDVPETVTVNAAGALVVPVSPLTSGTSNITLSNAKYSDATATINVTDPQMNASTAGHSLGVIAGKTSTVTISSSTVKILGGIDAVTDDSDIATIDEPSLTADANGNVLVTVRGLVQGSTNLTFTGANYAALVVPVDVWTTPLLASDADANALSLWTGAGAEPLTINSDQVALISGSAVAVESSDPTVVNVAESVTVDAAGSAVVNILPISAGTAQLTFSQVGYADITVAVTVNDPAFTTSGPAAVITGRSTTVTLTSADLTIAAGTVVDAVSDDSDIARVDSSSTANSLGVVTFSVTGVSAGTATLSFNTADHQTATVLVSVFDKPTIVSDSASTQSLTSGAMAEEMTVMSTQVPFAAGSVVAISNTDSTVVDVPDTAIVAADGTLTINVAPLTSGQASVTFAQNGYADYTVNYTVVDPALTVDNSTVSLISGRATNVVISSEDLALVTGLSIDAVTSDSDVAGVTPTAFADANHNITFTISAVAEGTATLTFTTANYGTVTVNVAVFNKPLMTSDEATTLSLLTGDATTVATVTSVQVPFAPGSTVAVNSTDSTVVDVVDVLTVNADGEAVLNIRPTNSGSSTLTLSQAGYADLTIEVAVVDPALVADATQLTLIAGRTTSFMVNSDQLALATGVAVDAVSSDSDIVSVSGSANAASGDATFQIRAITPGNESLTFSTANYGSLTVAIKVVIPTLSSDVLVSENGSSVLNLIAGDAATDVTVSSIEVPLAGTDIIAVESSDPTVVDVADRVAPVDGDAMFSLKPVSSGVAILTFTTADYTQLTVTVNVAEPRLLSSTDQNVTVWMGHTNVITINSDDLDLPTNAQIDVTSTDLEVVTMSATSVNVANGQATFRVTSAVEGATDIRFTSLGYQPVIVHVTVATPTMAAVDADGDAVTSLSLREGLVNGHLVISSADLDLVPGTVVQGRSSNVDAATLSGSGIVDAEGNVVFDVRAVADGSSVLTFVLSNYVTLSVNVKVETPVLATNAVTDIALFPGFDDVTVTVNSNDLALANGTSVSTVNSADAVVSVEASQVSASGTATFTLHALAAGEADITFLAAHYGEVTVHVVSVVPSLATNNDSLDLFKSQTGTVSINSAELGLTGDVTATTSDARTATVDESMSPEDGVATFTVTAVADGTATLTFSSVNYNDIQVTINVSTPALVAESATIDVFASGTAKIVITSDDLILTGDVMVDAETSNASVATVASTDSEDGTAAFTVSGLAVGSADLTFMAENYQSVTVQVNVVAPALMADPIAMDVLVGDVATVDITSNDLPLSDVTVNGASRNTKIATVDAHASSNNETATFTISGVFPGVTTMVFSTGQYTSVSVIVTVIAPALAADPATFEVMANTSTTIDITSGDYALGDGRQVTVVSSAPGVADAQVATVVSTDGVATFTISAISKGKVTLKFSSVGYKPVTAQVSVVLPALVTDTPTITVPAGGGSTTIDIVSNDVALGDATVTATSAKPDAVTVGVDAESAADTVDVSATSDAATFTVVGLVKGTYKVTFTAANYLPVVVKVVVVSPVLLSDVASVNVFVGATADVNISSDDLPIGDGREISAISYSESKIDFTNDGGSTVTSAGDNATFTVHGLQAGKTKITFTSPNFKSVVINVVVTTPALLASSALVTLTAGTTASVDITSDEAGLGDGRTIEASSSAPTVADVDSSIDSNGDVSTFTVSGLSKGTANLVFHTAGYKDVKVKVVVLAPALTADNSTLEIFAAGGTGSINIASDDLALGDGTAITATTAKSDDVVSVDNSVEAADGKATFTLTGVRKGKTKVTFTNALYKSVVVVVNVVTPSLLASLPSLQLLAGGTATFTVSSNDVALADDAAFTSTISMDAVSVSDPEIADGIATFTVTGLKKGKANIAISTPNYGKLKISVSVIEPMLTSNAPTGVSIVAGGTVFKVLIKSNDVPLSDDISLQVTGGDDTIVTISDPVIADGVATYDLTGVAAGKVNLTFKAENYVATKVSVTVTPSPVCKPATFGSLKFGDTDAKLSAASIASITKFAESIKKSNCSSVELTTYVPVPNTKATAAAYAKEVTLSNQRVLAVRGALSAALVKAKVTITITINVAKGTVPASVLSGPAAGQSAYRKVDVAAVAAPVSAMHNVR